MKQSIRFWLGFGIALNSYTLTSQAQAQPVPDATLPVNSIVTNQGNTSTITGGTRAGGNLFHSFSEFSVPTNGIAHFNNALDIQNIISRVTGGSVSNIDGLIRANGTANLFLINPNGIIFGPNASLNIGGSFVASTARAVKFADGTVFSAKTPAASPLLTVSVPIGLQYGVSAGRITNTVDNSSRPVGLQVQPGKTLALVGGDVRLDSETLTAAGGRVELGGLTTAGTVGLNVDSNNLSLSFPPGVAPSNVSLANGSLVDVAAGGGGSIAVNAQNLNVLGKSILSAGISTGSGAVGTQAGDITLNATGAITVSASNIFNNVESKAVGNAGYISINAGSLSLSDGAQLSASTYGQGNAGSVFVQAKDSVSLAGGETQILTLVGSQQAEGKGGDILIQARALSVTGGAELIAQTLGRGDAGNILVNATDSVELSGVAPFPVLKDGGIGGFSSGLFANTAVGSTGDGGSIFIDLSRFSITDGAGVAVNSLGSGQGGSLNVQTGYLTLDNRAFLSARANSGNGGNISLNVPSLLQARHNSQISAISGGSGNGGNIYNNIRFLVLLENSDISANAFKGNGGNLNITSEAIFGNLLGRNFTQVINLTATSRYNMQDRSRLIAQGCPAYAQPQAKKIAVTPSPNANLSARARNRNTGSGRMEAAIDPVAALPEPSKFVVSGRGGMPPSPTQPLSSDSVLTNWNTLDHKTNHRSVKAHSSDRTSPPPTQIVEATGWVIGPKGEVILTALAPTVTPDIPWLRSAECHAQ